ncbi:lipoprotein [Bdellovibrio sp.]|uniref:LptM family lipoprotein n=1 Tax=Bdellovibrio sp. TaxID=28201 RepID=UPI0039E6C161
MLPMLHKHTVITAALLASLSLTACGKKKDLIAPPPESTAEQTAEQTTQKSGTQTDNTNGQIGGGLPNPNSPGTDDYQPPLPEPIPEPKKQPAPPKQSGGTKTETPKQGSQTTTPPAPPAPAKPVEPAKPSTPPVVDTRPAPALGTNPLPPDYRTNDVGNSTRDNLTKRMTGGVTSDGLVYTSSSTDELLNFLRARNEKVDAGTRRLNLEAASSVLSAKMTIDGLTNDAIVTLKVQEGRDVKVYNVAGAVGEGVASPLRSVRAGNGEITTGTRPLDGTLKCVDLDGGCETTFVRLKIGATGSSAILNLVFRSSAADIYFHLPGQYSDNPEYLIMREFAISTIQRLNTDNKIKSVRMSSWEVVNGRSGVTLSMKGANNELLAFAGPLLAPEAGTGVNITLSRIAKDQEDTLDLISLQNTKLNYANWIGDARMIANNGLGQVRIALKMRKRANFAQDQFAVTFMRKIKPLVDLTDDNLK